MKRLLYISCLFTTLCLMSQSNAKAQITNISFNGGWDSLTSYCASPTQGILYFDCNVTGTPIPNDSVKVYVNYGDGTDTTWKIEVQLFAGGFSFDGFLIHNYTMTGSFSSLVIASINGLADTIINAPLAVSNSCASLSGNVYYDANGNCIKDASEFGFNNKTIKFTNTSTNVSVWAYTDYNGNYSIDLQGGFTYTIQPQVNTYSFAGTCPTGGTTNLAISGSSYVQNFGYNCASTWDAFIDGWAWNWRPSFVRYLYIDAGLGNYCDSFPAVITLTLPSTLSVVNMSNPGTFSGNTVTWNINPLSGLSGWGNTLGIYCDPSVNIGDTLCVTLNITTTPADANSSNNTVTICAPVNNSMDPNEKTVFPRGTGPTGKILNGTELNYLINFQNTGNDSAINITVADSIDSDLDIATINIKKSSHPMGVFKDDNNVVKFHFENIMLPDSNHSEPASHGYILYSIKPKPGLASGTQIKNTAYIYFDYNQAIITNNTLNTISVPVSVNEVEENGLKATIFPNPANNNLIVEVKDYSKYSLELYDLTGRKVITQNSFNTLSAINTSSLINGSYLLRIVTEENKTLSTVISIQH